MGIDTMLKNLRRLTGANFLMTDFGAAAEATIEDGVKPIAMALWRQNARFLLDAVGWADSKIAMRAFDGGATLQISAPTDALHAATDLVQAAWTMTTSKLNDTEFDKAGTVLGLSEAIAAELSPNEVALAHAARENGVTYLGHDAQVSLGLGKGAKVYDVAELPGPADVDWSAVHDVPVAMVTGTNGKSTTVRLTAAIGAAAQKCVGLSSSDWVRVGGEILDEGDYSGPAGARLAVRDPRVEMAVIETARGGLMRRGLPVPSADACLLTNVSADHLGTYGVMDVTALADAKFQLSKSVKEGGRLVLNADDPELVQRSPQFEGDITWFGLNFDQTALDVWIANGGRAAFVTDGQMMLARDGQVHPVIKVADFVPALGGAAKFNVYNALGAIGLADALGLPISAMTKGLAGFTDSPDENPGRGNYMKVGNLTLLIDFAHNPHGAAALVSAINSIPANRRMVITSQAGDRSDQDICDMMQALWGMDPELVIVAELPSMLRGRQSGEITKVFTDELRRLGVPDDCVIEIDSEYLAVRAALEWAQPGDFLALLVHEERIKAMELIETLQTSGWQAGDPLPE